MKVTVICLWMGLLLASCGRNERLEYALDFAGNNRVELEKVFIGNIRRCSALCIGGGMWLFNHNPSKF